MKCVYVILLSLLVSAVTAAPLEIKNQKAIDSQSRAKEAKVLTNTIKASPDYITYTNIIALLNAANNWGDAKPLLIKYIKVQQGLQAADEVYTGKKEKKNTEKSK